MSDPAPPCLLSHFSALKDPRQAAKVLYPLDENLLLLLCATIAGADDFVEIGMIESETERGSVVETQRRYYFCSKKLDAKTLARTVRSRWGVENGLHWVLDVVFRDDLARLRLGNGPANMAVVKCAAMNLLAQAKPVTSLKNRRKRAGWNQDYLEKIVWQIA